MKERPLRNTAAERERFDTMEDKWQALAASRYNDAKQLREQLAAERAKCQTLMDALELMPQVAYKAIIEGAGVSVENLPNELQCIADAALAKVEDQPVQLPMINDDPILSLK